MSVIASGPVAHALDSMARSRQVVAGRSGSRRKAVGSGASRPGVGGGVPAGRRRRSISETWERGRHLAKGRGIIIKFVGQLFPKLLSRWQSVEEPPPPSGRPLRASCLRGPREVDRGGASRKSCL